MKIVQTARLNPSRSGGLAQVGRKIALVAALGLFLSPITHSRPLSDQEPPDVLDNKDCYFIGSFTQQKSLSGLSTLAESAGQFIYSCDRGVIWSTNTPELETLVLKSETTTSKAIAYRLVDGLVERLKSRQSRFLTELIMNLMSSDQTGIASSFTAEKNEDGSATLVPKKRQLKRAIKKISFSKLTDKQFGVGQSGIRIVIIDRNLEKTVIEAVRTPLLEPSSLESCVEVRVPEKACALFFSSLKVS